MDYRNFEHDRSRKPARMLTPAEFKRRAWACGGILVAAFALGVSAIGGEERKTSDQAVCEGKLEHTVDAGQGISNLLSRVEGGLANPNDATEAIQRMNPNIADRLEEPHPILPEGITLTLPEACVPESANRIAR